MYSSLKIVQLILQRYSADSQHGTHGGGIEVLFKIVDLLSRLLSQLSRRLQLFIRINR